MSKISRGYGYGVFKEFVVNDYNELISLYPPASNANKFATVKYPIGAKWRQALYGGDYHPDGRYYCDGITWDDKDIPQDATLDLTNEGENKVDFVTPFTLKRFFKFGEIDIKFTEIDTKFGEIDTKFGEIDTKFGEIDTKFTSIDNKFTEIDGRLDALEAGAGMVTTIILTAPSSYTLPNLTGLPNFTQIQVVNFALVDKTVSSFSAGQPISNLSTDTTTTTEILESQETRKFTSYQGRWLII